SNAAAAPKIGNPAGWTLEGRWLRCSSVTERWWLCSFVAPCQRPSRVQRTPCLFMRWVLVKPGKNLLVSARKWKLSQFHRRQPLALGQGAAAFDSGELPRDAALQCFQRDP